MQVPEITVRYSDGTCKTMPVQPDQSILEAAEEHGIAIVNECQSGDLRDLRSNLRLR